MAASATLDGWTQDLEMWQLRRRRMMTNFRPFGIPLSWSGYSFLQLL